MTDRRAFDTSKRDVQASPVEPVDPGCFDYEAFLAREERQLDCCRAFRDAGEGILVHRRMRVAEVFSDLCGDMPLSLRLQLGGLQAGLAYLNDCPNFLEPWYGIGTVAAAWGAEYAWEEGQAPVVRPLFSCAREALDAPTRPVRDTPIGRRTLEMADYFLESTGGRLPVSLTDTQSPFNTACQVVDTSRLLLDMMDDPATVSELLLRVADHLIEFTRDQLELLGPAAVFPGHGFASSRVFGGVGFSDDNILMVSEGLYREVVLPSVSRLAAAFGEVAFHSCGNWSRKVPLVMSVPGIGTVDGAFTARTDPFPNPPEPFAGALPGTSIVLNARMVGDADTVAETVSALWRPGAKLIAVTYCATPEEQRTACERLRGLALAGDPPDDGRTAGR